MTRLVTLDIRNLSHEDQRIVLMYFHGLSDELTDTQYYRAMTIVRMQDIAIGWATDPVLNPDALPSERMN